MDIDSPFELVTPSSMSAVAPPLPEEGSMTAERERGKDNWRDRERRGESRRRSDDVFLMIEQVDEKHSDAHHRLRIDLQTLKAQVDLLQEKVRDNGTRIDTVAAKPVDATELIFSPRVVFAIVAAVLSIAAGMWGSTYGLRSDVRSLLQTYEAAAAMQKMQYDSLKTSQDAFSRRQELQQYEIQGLKEMILTGKQRVK